MDDFAKMHFFGRQTVAFAALSLLAGCSLILPWGPDTVFCDPQGRCPTGTFCEEGTCLSKNTSELCRVEDAGAGPYSLTLYSELQDGGALWENHPPPSARMTTSFGVVNGRVLLGNFYGDGGMTFATLGDLQGDLQVSTLGAAASQPVWACGVPTYAIAGVEQRVAAGDFDGDGIDDIALFYQYEPSRAVALHVIRFSGGGCGYQGNSGWWPDAGPQTLMNGHFAAGEFTGDKKKDLVSLYGSGSGATLRIYRSTGSAFVESDAWSSAVYDKNATADRFLVGDFSGDTKDDVALFVDADAGVEIHLWTAAGSPDGGFTQTVAWKGSEVTFAEVSPLAVALDFDQNGKSDIAALVPRSCGCGELTVFRSAGDGGFTLDSSRGRWCPDGLVQDNPRLMVWP